MKHPHALLTLIAALAPLVAGAEVRLPNIFSNHMVLQRGVPLKVWGTADDGEKISLKFGPRTFSTTADERGAWVIELPALKADGGKSPQITLKGKHTIVLEDILIGDVWITRTTI